MLRLSPPNYSTKEYLNILRTCHQENDSKSMLDWAQMMQAAPQLPERAEPPQRGASVFEFE